MGAPFKTTRKRGFFVGVKNLVRTELPCLRQLDELVRRFPTLRPGRTIKNHAKAWFFCWLLQPTNWPTVALPYGPGRKLITTQKRNFCWGKKLSRAKFSAPPAQAHLVGALLGEMRPSFFFSNPLPLLRFLSKFGVML